MEPRGRSERDLHERTHARRGGAGTSRRRTGALATASLLVGVTGLVALGASRSAGPDASSRSTLQRGRFPTIEPL